MSEDNQAPKVSYGAFVVGSVHALDLAVHPGMAEFGQAMFHAIAKTDLVEGMAVPAGGWGPYSPLATKRN